MSFLGGTFFDIGIMQGGFPTIGALASGCTGRPWGGGPPPAPPTPRNKQKKKKKKKQKIKQKKKK